MKTRTIIGSTAVLALVAVLGVLVTMAKPSGGWFAAGSDPKDYDMGISSMGAHSGSSAAYIRSKVKSANGFGTYMQMIQPGKFAGKKVKMTSFIKSSDITDWAGMWMRVDDDTQVPLSFDNMQDRPIKGTSNWKAYEITLDVPQNAKAVAYGVLLSGTGEVDFDDVKFEILGPAGPVAKTGMTYPLEPTNLDFEAK